MPLQQYKNWITYFAFLCIGWISINLAQGPVGLENRVYLANNISVVEDFDLNIINNVPKDSRWIVSPTYNFPDMHFDGEAALHLPESFIAKLIKPFFPAGIKYGLGEDTIYLFAMCISTITYFFIALMLLSKMFWKTNDQISNSILSLFLLSTPVLYWTFSDYSSTDSLCFFLSSAILFKFLNSRFETEMDFFQVGTLLGFGLVLKPSYLFYVPLFFMLLYKYKASMQKILIFILPVVFFLFCKYLNSYLRFGFPTYLSGYEYAFFYDLHSIATFLKNYYWGPFGIVHQAPWFLVILVLLAGNVQLIRKNPLLIGIAAAIFLKVLYEILCLSNSETEFGFRRFVIDIPFLLYFLFSLLENSQLQFKKILNGLFSLTFIYLIIYWFWYRRIDSLSPSPIGVFKLWEYFPFQFSFLETVQFFERFNIFQYAAAFAVVFLMITINFFALTFSKNKFNYKWFSASLLILYALVTTLNLANNKSNVEALKKENFFEQMVVSENKNAFLYDEFFSEVGRDILIAKYKKDLKSFSFSKQLALNYIDTLNEGLIADPIHFKELNLQHKIKPIYYLNDAITTDSIFNYDSETRFDEIIKK